MPNCWAMPKRKGMFTPETTCARMQNVSLQTEWCSKIFKLTSQAMEFLCLAKASHHTNIPGQGCKHHCLASWLLCTCKLQNCRHSGNEIGEPVRWPCWTAIPWAPPTQRSIHQPMGRFVFDSAVYRLALPRLAQPPRFNPEISKTA